MFIKKPEKQCSKTTKKIKQFLLMLLVPAFLEVFVRRYFGISVDSDLFESKFENPKLLSQDVEVRKKAHNERVDFIFQVFVIGCFNIVTTIFTYKSYSHWYRYSTEYSICKNFIADWPEYKDITPEELQSYFDLLHEKYEKDQLTDDEVYEMVAVIKEVYLLKQLNPVG